MKIHTDLSKLNNKVEELIALFQETTNRFDAKKKWWDEMISTPGFTYNRNNFKTDFRITRWYNSLYPDLDLRTFVKSHFPFVTPISKWTGGNQTNGSSPFVQKRFVEILKSDLFEISKENALTYNYCMIYAISMLEAFGINNSGCYMLPDGTLTFDPLTTDKINDILKDITADIYNGEIHTSGEVKIGKAKRNFVFEWDRLEETIKGLGLEKPSIKEFVERYNLMVAETYCENPDEYRKRIIESEKVFRVQLRRKGLNQLFLIGNIDETNETSMKQRGNIDETLMKHRGNIDETSMKQSLQNTDIQTLNFANNEEEIEEEIEEEEEVSSSPSRSAVPSASVAFNGSLRPRSARSADVVFGETGKPARSEQKAKSPDSKYKAFKIELRELRRRKDLDKLLSKLYDPKDLRVLN